MRQIFLDLETTGLNPYRHQILEIACMNLDGARPFSEPISYKEYIVEPGAIKCNGINLSEHSGRSLDNVRSRLINWLMTQGETCEYAENQYQIIGFNPCFDLMFLRAIGLADWFTHRVIDLNSILLFLNIRKEDLHTELKVNKNKLHSAAYDCQVAKFIWEYLRKNYGTES